jgi:hypothetical protein
MHRFKVKLAFLVVDFGVMSISTTRGRPRPEVTSSVDIATMVYHSCSSNIFCLSCTVSTVYAVFLLLKMAECQFLPLGGMLDRK